MCVRQLFSLFCLAIFFPFPFQPCFHVATIFNSSQILHICKNVQPRVWGAESPSSFACEQKSTKWVFVLHGETCPLSEFSDKKQVSPALLKTHFRGF